MDFFFASATGPVRKTNQDAAFADLLQSGVFIASVCDGMGGAAAGDTASNAAVKVIKERLENAFSEAPADGFDFYGELRAALADADDEIRRLVLLNPEFNGMGTTAVSVIAYGGKAYIANIGDSRCYKLAKKNLERITHDHSYVQLLVDSGKITEKEAEKHPQKNIITRSIGGMEKAEPDFYSVSTDSVLLLCSDGLTNYVSEKNIAKIISSKSSANEAVTKLLAEAIKNGGGDNVTAVVVDFTK